METISLSQTDTAALLGVEQPTLSEATSEGHKIGGYCVRAWANFDAAGRVSSYDVPLKVARRRNPATSEEVMDELESQQRSVLSTNGQKSEGGMTDALVSMPGLSRVGRTWPDTVAETAGPVSGNVGGTVIGQEFIGLLKEKPQLADYLLDIGVPLTFAGIAAYVVESGDWAVLRVIGSAVGAWAVIRLVREACTTSDQQHARSAVGGMPRQSGVNGRSGQRRLSGGRRGNSARGEARPNGVRTNGTH